MKHASLVKMCLIALLCGLPLVSATGCHQDHKKNVKTYTLRPNEKKRIEFKSAQETTLSFNTDLSSADREKIEKGFRVSHINPMGEGEILTSKTNLHIKVPPDEGKVSVLVENLEKISIKLFVSWPEH